MNGVEVARREGRLEEECPRLWVVEIDKEVPVDEPRARVKLCRAGSGRLLALADAEARREEEVREAMASLRVLTLSPFRVMGLFSAS